MRTGDILDLYRFNDWANGRLVSATAALPVETVLRNVDGSFRSIRDLLAHLVSTEWVWLERWSGSSPSAIPGWVGSDDVASLSVRLDEVRARRDSFLAGLSEPALLVEVSFRYISGRSAVHPLWESLVHVVNHSTYHRGQLASLLRGAGVAPPSTDFIVYKAESRG